MRIVYGVHGYGRGHATRALAMLRELRRRHDVLVLAGGDAFDALAQEHPVARIPTFGYEYRAQGGKSNWLTFRKNAPAALDLLTCGNVSAMVEQVLRDFDAHVAISDAEPWTSHAAARLSVPRISFDHFGILAHFRPPMSMMDRGLCLRDVGIYRALMGRPERAIVSSFYDAPAARSGVELVGPILRPEVYDTPVVEGDYLLAYFNKGAQLFSRRVESALRDARLPVIVYGVNRVGRAGLLEFRPPGNHAFVQALAGCRAVVSTAGNQLVGEAAYFEKPLLVMPEDCVEQRVNGAAVARLGLGLCVAQRSITAAVVREFLQGAATCRPNLRRHQSDGRAAAVQAIERYVEELTGSRPAPKVTRVA